MRPSACITRVIVVGAALCCSPVAFCADSVAETTADTVAVLRKTTVTATRTEENVDEVPATVSVITDRQIEDELATDIKDLVRFEPGVAVRNNPARFTAAGSPTGRDGNSGFNIRGLEGNRVLILVDGVRVPDAYSFGAQSMGRGDYVDLDALKTVEILRGPASALYGSDGLAGAVSFTTKNPDDFLGAGADWGVRTRASYASADESSSEGIAMAGRAGPWQALLSYTRRDAAEQDSKGSNDAANVSRTTPIPQDIASNAVLGKLVFEPNDAHRMRLTLDHFDRRVDSNVLSAIAIPPLAATSTLALTASDDIKRDRISIDHRYEADSGWLASAQTALYYQTSRTQEYAAEDRNTAADRTRDSTFDNKVVGFGAQLTSLLSFGDIEQRWVYGVDASRTRQEGVRDGTIPPAGETFPARAFPTTDHSLAGLYVQDELAVFDGRLMLYPALRYDYYSIDPQDDPLFTANAPQTQHDTHLSPKFGVVLPVGEIVGLFANYGAGFKAPAPSQVNNGFTNPVQFYRSISNPDLKPETSETVEAGVRLHFAHASASLTGFSGRYQDFIDQLQIAGNFTAANPGIFQYINRGRVKISGAELKAEAELGRGFALQTAASYARGTSTTNGIDAPLNSIEPWKLVAGVNWRNASGRYGGQLVATHSAGKQPSRVDQSACSVPSCFTPPGFTILDTTAWWNFTDSLTLRVGVFNLADKKYWWWSDVRGQPSTSGTLDAYSQPGRNASASLTWRL
jgi:hemoglobin/transferrin/lactoferrin receptor protein